VRKPRPTSFNKYYYLVLCTTQEPWKERELLQSAV
jgi:hypothetical protein